MAGVTPAPVVGGYLLLDLLGRSDRGEVYRAAHESTGRIVALRILSRPSAEARERFEREARLHERVSHPGIAAVEGMFECDGSHVQVMEFARGQRLVERIAERRGLGPADAFTIFRPIVAATASLRRAGVLSADLRPTNIRIAPDGTVKLLDCAMGRRLHVRAPGNPGPVANAALYLSPEELRDGEPSRASAVWTLGTLLYEMLVGGPPFVADTMADLWSRVLVGAYLPPSALVVCTARERRAVEAADRLIAKCLTVRVEDRPTLEMVLWSIERTQGEHGPVSTFVRAARELQRAVWRRPRIGEGGARS